MGTSGNPAKKAAQARISSPADFKARKRGIVLPLPSGMTVRAKRVGLGTFIKQGEVPNPLIPIVEEALQRGQKTNPAEVMLAEKGMDLDLVKNMYEMVDAVVMGCILEPEVHPVPKDDAERDDDLVYVDDVDDEDKMFIFQWASGGTSDVERFREQAATDLATLAESQGVVLTTEPALGAR